MVYIFKGSWKPLVLTAVIVFSTAFGVLLARYGVHVISFAQ